MTAELVVLIIVATAAAAIASLVAGRAGRARTDAVRELLDRERELADQRHAGAEQQRQQLAEQFTALSIDALDANGRRFMELASTQLVQPVTTKLAEVERKIAAFDAARAESAGQLAGQIGELRASGEQLRAGTTALTRALRQPQGRGRWGEMQLKRVVEVAGMSEHARDFSTQQSTTSGDDERRLRPDMVVNLSSGRCVVIDSKVPLDAYLDAMEADDDDAAAPHLDRHARQVRTHVDQLSRKDYSSCLDGALADMVVLFLPAEHLFAAAVQRMPNLVEEAFDKQIVIASPTTLLTLLHAVAMGWREERLARNAEEIAQLGRELHHRIATMANHFTRVGKGLDAAMSGYNAAVGSLESSVLPQARRFEQLDAAKASTEMPMLEERSIEIRRLQARELLAESS
jgi:DNA recombination protein RmuC